MDERTLAERIGLDDALRALFDRVYFQPPDSIKMEYPALVYERSGLEKRYANNGTYISAHRWTLTYITDDPDDVPTYELDGLFDYISYDRTFVNDNLYHHTYTLVY